MMPVNVHLEVPGGHSEVLLHACCAPCSSAIVECMMQQGVRPVIYYSNSNIHPFGEFEHRRSECERYAQKWGVGMVVDEYDHDAWLAAVRGLENERERGPRCLQCFRHRLLRAAVFARAHGYAVLTTTLASSRWKRLDQVNEAGEWACREANALPMDGPQVVWWDQNWRKGGLQERRNEIIREMDFYNQLYCGCEFGVRNSSSIPNNSPKESMM